MSGQKSSSDNRKLINQLSPDASLGRLLGMLATTYEMQPEFFETDFLPTVLGLGAWDDRNWTSRIALEKHLAELESAGILMDARPYQGRPRSLRVEVLPVPLTNGRLLHAKVVLSVFENAVRLIVGSANLTEPGYRRNREVVAVITASISRPVEAKLISEAIRGLKELLSPWQSENMVDLCQAAEDRLSQWKQGDAAGNQWFAWSGGATPLWKQFLNLWPQQERVSRIRIVSPFWSEEQPRGPVTRFISELKSMGCLADDAELYLYTEAAPDKRSTYKPSLPETFHNFDATAIGVRAFAVAVNPCVHPEEVSLGEDFTGSRALHAKTVLLQGDQTCLAYLGSANFTNRGWGFLQEAAAANIEAGIILRAHGEDGAGLHSLIPQTTGDAVSLSGAAAGEIAVPAPSPDELPWPFFLREVRLSPVSDSENVLELVVLIDMVAATGAWELAFLSSEGRVAEKLLHLGAGEATQPEYRLRLTERQLTKLLRDQEVFVSWWDYAGGRTFPINVAADARLLLPISPSFGEPAEQSLIAYYQGRITWEDLFPDPLNDAAGGSCAATDVDLERNVDTSRIQSYVVREFVEALNGINDDLKEAAKSTRACMRLALLGTVSPVALAHRVYDAADRSERSPTAAGFQLVEILGCLDAALRHETSPTLLDDWRTLVKEAAAIVARMVDDLVSRFPDELSREFRRYAKTVRRHYQTENG